MAKKSKIKIITLDEAKKRLKNIHNSLLKNGRTMGLRRIEEYKRKMKDTIELVLNPEDFAESCIRIWRQPGPSRVSRSLRLQKRNLMYLFLIPLFTKCLINL